MPEPALSEAKRRIVDLLKREGPVSASDLARSLKLTDVAIRQHLQGLEAAGLAWSKKKESKQQEPKRRGRPSLGWSLTEAAASLFPDRHGELTVGLLEAMRETFGDKGLERVIAKRSLQQVQRYRSSMPAQKASLKARVVALAKLRTEEGYLAEVITEKRGCYLLVEHHCPICDAAKCCLRLCGAELEVFQEALGESVLIERTSHLLSGDDRCVYRVQKQKG
ncbi:MAG: putative ArsR family transcriptional regulator [Planctomycetota bacterium]|jgi:predicted ArsR family transcriptional regulator